MSGPDLVMDETAGPRRGAEQTVLVFPPGGGVAFPERPGSKPGLGAPCESGGTRNVGGTGAGGVSHVFGLFRRSSPGGAEGDETALGPDCFPFTGSSVFVCESTSSMISVRR